MLPKFKQIIEASWYQKPRGWNILLLPLSGLFMLVSWLRRSYYRCVLPKKFAVPVIIVGNITVGGTGKTPLVIYLAQLLQKQGYRPGVISRGYAGKSHACVLVTAQSDPTQVGDEPVLMAQRIQVPIIVSRKRVVAVQKLLAEYNCNVIISDDGLQHYALARDIEIAVIDGTRRLGNGWRLPAGPLREASQRLQSVDFIVSTGKAEAGEYALHIKVGNLHNLFNQQQVNLDIWRGKKIFAVAGIGNNQRFFDLLTNQGLDVVPHAFSDHYAYQRTDFQELLAEPNIPIIMTEKDAVKCRNFATEQFWYLPVTAELSQEFATKLLEKVKLYDYSH